MTTLDELLAYVPEDLLRRSGSLLYSGRSAWSGEHDVYLLGLNPGGAEAEGLPAPNGDEPSSLQSQIDEVLARGEDRWSAYTSESWKERPAGEAPMQQRVRHLLRGLGLKPEDTPASNLVFVRTRSEKTLGTETEELAEACWPFHQGVINGLGTRAILCLGATTGSWVRAKLGATPEPVDTFVETNNRRWTSTVHRTSDGRAVVTLTHPSWADWRNPDADPVPMVLRAIKASRLEEYLRDTRN